MTSVWTCVHLSVLTICLTFDRGGFFISLLKIRISIWISIWISNLCNSDYPHAIINWILESQRWIYDCKSSDVYRKLVWSCTNFSQFLTPATQPITQREEFLINLVISVMILSLVIHWWWFAGSETKTSRWSLSSFHIGHPSNSSPLTTFADHFRWLSPLVFSSVLHRAFIGILRRCSPAVFFSSVHATAFLKFHSRTGRQW